MRMLIELEIEGDPAHAFGVVDALLDNGEIQDLINHIEEACDNDECAGGLEVTSAISRADIVYVGFVIHQATGQLCWSKAFTSEKAARDYAERKAADRNYRHRPGQPLEYVSRVESYEVQS